MFVAGSIVSQPQAVLSGNPAVLFCGRDPDEPVKWTFQASLDSVVKDVRSSERFGLPNSSLIIYSVEVHDSGSYNCTDATDELYHTIQLTVHRGKLCKHSLVNYMYCALL